MELSAEFVVMPEMQGAQCAPCISGIWFCYNFCIIQIHVTVTVVENVTFPNSISGCSPLERTSLMPTSAARPGSLYQSAGLLPLFLISQVAKSQIRLVP